MPITIPSKETWPYIVPVLSTSKIIKGPVGAMACHGAQKPSRGLSPIAYPDHLVEYDTVSG